MGFMSSNEIKTEIENPSKEDTLAVLSGKLPPYIEHANWFNEYYGLPTINVFYLDLNPARVALTMIHYEQYAREMGWIGND